MSRFIKTKDGWLNIDHVEQIFIEDGYIKVWVRAVSGEDLGDSYIIDLDHYEIETFNDELAMSLLVSKLEGLS